MNVVKAFDDRSIDHCTTDNICMDKRRMSPVGYRTLTRDQIATRADKYPAVGRYDVEREFAQRYYGP